MKPTRSATLLVVLLVVCAGLPAAAGEIDKKFHESFDVAGGATLRLEHGDGDVEIRPWDRNVIDVRVRYRARVASIQIGKQRDFDVDFRQDGNVVRVTGRETGGHGVSIGVTSTQQYTYTIQAPAWVKLELDGDDGDVDVADWTGSVFVTLEDGDMRLSDISAEITELETEDGDLTLDGMSGELSVETEDGDVVLSGCTTPEARLVLEDGDLTVRQCEGSFEIETEDGDVRFDDVRADRLRVRSADGSVRLHLRGDSRIDAEIITDDGAVQLDLGAGLSATFKLETGDGRIRVALPAARVDEESKRRVSGAIGAGEGRIRVRTSDGSIQFQGS